MRGKAVAAGEAAVARVQSAVTIDQPLLDRAQWLVGRHVALAVVVHGGGAVAVIVAAMAEAQGAGNLAEIVRMGERTVHMPVGNSAQQPTPVVQVLRPANEAVVDTERAAGQRDLIGDLVGEVHVGRGNGAEIAHRCVIRTLGVIQPVRNLGHQEVQIGVTLAVRIGGPVDRHVIDEVGDVRAMVHIEAARQVLVGLALAGMHGHHQARNALEQLSHPIHGAQIQFLLRHRTLAGGGGLAQQVQSGCGDDHFGERAAGGVRRGCRSASRPAVPHQVETGTAHESQGQNASTAC